MTKGTLTTKDGSNTLKVELDNRGGASVWYRVRIEGEPIWRYFYSEVWTFNKLDENSFLPYVEFREVEL